MTVENMHDEWMHKMHDALMTNWNIQSIAKQYLTSKFNGSDKADEIDINELSQEEEKLLNKMFSVYSFIGLKQDKTDWSTQNIGTFFVKTAMDHHGIDEIHDAFTPPNDNVSWPDLAMMYNLKDFRTLIGSKLSTPAKYKPILCEDYDFFCLPGSQERYSSFQSCFENIMGKMDEDESFDEHTFKKEFIARKDIQPSPCSDLVKFPSCIDYCTWHENYFQTIHKVNFLQAMSYASYQRKIVKDSTADEKDIAGKKI